MALLESATAATEYTVGDSYGWDVPPISMMIGSKTRHFRLEILISTHYEQGQKVKIVIGDGISDTGSASSLVAGALSTLVFQFLALYCA
ncbi:hypothetical protein QYF36_008820 [Acer negundo]|nr:hypothetical protein QYF36_008820 [Acer negundo]